MSTKRHASRLKIYLFIFLSVMGVGVLGFMFTEGLSLIDAIYFTIVTISTVGYGDLTPQSPIGKILALLLIFTGAGTFVSIIALGTDAFLDRREQEARQKKIEMLIGLFYSEVGNKLLSQFVSADRNSEIRQQPNLMCQKAWSEKDFAAARTLLHQHDYVTNVGQVDLPALCSFLQQNHDLVVRLLESPYLLEHNRFSDLLIAFLHLKEELGNRTTLTGLPQADLDHLSGDIHRVYQQLAQQWLDYLVHLQSDYPFLYALAIRTNPFNPKASVVIH